MHLSGALGETLSLRPRVYAHFMKLIHMWALKRQHWLQLLCIQLHSPLVHQPVPSALFFCLVQLLFQELSKIAMPVVFNEPLSFLQRLAEYMEHTYLIHQANTTTDSVERMKVSPGSLLPSLIKSHNLDYVCI